MSRCVQIPTSGGGYCLSCVEQPEIPYIPEHVEEVAVAAWNAGADMWDDANDVPLVIDGACEFVFTVPNSPVGLMMGFFNAAVARERTNPSSLVSVYVTMIGAQIVVQAYRYGVLVGSPKGVSPGTIIKGQRNGNGVNFLAAGTVFVRTTIDPGATSCGACLFHSDDNIPAADFYALTDPPTYGEGSNVVAFAQRGNSRTSFGLNTIRFPQHGASPPHGSNVIAFEQLGNEHADNGTNVISFSQTGSGSIQSPQINGGSNVISFEQEGEATHAFYAAGSNFIQFTQRGNTKKNYGFNTISFAETGGTAPVLDNYIVGFMSPGVAQIVFGYDHYTLEDGIAFNAGLTTRLMILLQETLALSEHLGTVAALHVVLRDGLALSDKFLFKFLAILTDTIALSEEVRISTALRLLDTLVLEGEMSSVLDAKCLLATTLTFLDALSKNFSMSLADTIALSDTLGNLWNQKMALVDSIEFSDTMTGSFTLVMRMADSLALGDDMAAKLRAMFTLADEIDFSAALRINGGSGNVDLYIAYAINTASRGATRYLNYPFNSFAQVGSRLFGGSDKGLLALEGGDDDGAPIKAKLRTGLDSLGSTLLKRMTKAYLGYRADGGLLLRIDYTSPRGERTSEVFRAYPLLAEDFRETNVDISKGMKSVYWAFEIENEDGADFALDCISVIPLNCENRANG